MQDSGEKDNGVETPPTVDKTLVELPNSDEPRKNTPLRRSQRQIKPSLRFSDYEHEISIKYTGIKSIFKVLFSFRDRR